MKVLTLIPIFVIFIFGKTRANPVFDEPRNDDEELIHSFAVKDYDVLGGYEDLKLDSSKVPEVEEVKPLQAVPYFLITFISTITLSITSSITTYSSCYSTLVALNNCNTAVTVATTTTVSGKRRRRKRESGDDEEDENVIVEIYNEDVEEGIIRATKVQPLCDATETSLNAAEEKNQSPAPEVEDTAAFQGRLFRSSTSTITSISSVVVQQAATQTVVLTTDANGNGCFPSALFSSSSVTAC